MVDEEYRSVLVKNYHMVNDPSSDSVISWGPDGKSFIVWNPHELSRDYLPRELLDSFTDMLCEGYDSFSFFTDMLLQGYDFAKVDPNQQWEFSKNDFTRDKPEITLNKYTPVNSKKLDMNVAQIMIIWINMMKRKGTSFKCAMYLMVEDPSSDSIISWSPSGKSFIVWDPAELSRVLLPRFLFLNNFSLFRRMLRDYGFKKVDPERWEFAEEGFVRGKPQFLENKYNRAQVWRLGMKKRIMKKQTRMSKIAVEAVKDQMQGLQI